MELCVLPAYCSASEVVTYLVRHSLLRPDPRGPVLAGFPRTCCVPRFLKLGNHPLLGCHSPSGHSQRPPPRSGHHHAVAREAWLLSWGFAPFSGRQYKGSGVPGASTPRHLASSEFEPPLTPCSPSHLPYISARAALGIATFRAFLLPRIPAAFRLAVSPPGVARSDRSHASNAICRTHHQRDS